MLNKKSIIALTGSNGFIGRYLLEHLRKQNCTVLELCRHLNSAKDKNYFYKFEMAKAPVIPKLDTATHLVHCAYDFTINSKLLLEKVYLRSTELLFKSAIDSGVENIIFISTIFAFPKAKSIYGQVKHKAEQIALDHGAIIIRPGLVFCQQQQYGIVAAMQKFVRISPAIPMIGNGNMRLYPCYLPELANLIHTILTSRNIHEVLKPITAANPEGITFREMIELFASQCNKRIIKIPIPVKVLFAALKFIDLITIKLSFGYDNLMGAYHTNTKIDFSQPPPFSQKFSNIQSHIN